MADDIDTILATIESHYDSAWQLSLDAEDRFDFWVHDDYWFGNNVPECFVSIEVAVKDLALSIRWLLSRKTYTDYHYRILHSFGLVGGDELTWQAICEAWAANSFEGRAGTIAFIDHMRKLLWNEPFNAVWASGPTIVEM